MPTQSKMVPMHQVAHFAAPTLAHNSVPTETGCHDIDVSKLTIQQVGRPKDLPDLENLDFGASFTDHMLQIIWTEKAGWHAPQIVPYQPLSLDPASSVFHYSFECYEGMKAYRDQEGNIRLFRPKMNMVRLNRSAARICLPTFDPDKLLELLKTYIKLEERFIPKAKGYALYLRPTMIGTHAKLGIDPPKSALLFVIASTVGPYYKTGFKAVNLEAVSNPIRAWPGGVGDQKLGGNYAPCIASQVAAANRGFQQVLWLFGKGEYVTEVGTMNMFAAIKSKSGQKELVTAPLDGTILAGVTRDSILSLAREYLVPEGWLVSERKFSIKELAEAADDDRILEAFGCGTAATVCPVRAILWRDRLIQCGLNETQEAGQVALRMKNWIESIQYGGKPHFWSMVIT